MHRPDHDSAVAVRPATTPEGTPGWFQDGNPAEGVRGTVMEAEFINDLMANCLAVCEAGGVPPVKGEDNNLRDAILAMIAAGNRGQQVFTTSGTFTVPAGVTGVVVEVWGAGGGGAGGPGSGGAGGGGAGGGGYAIKRVTGLVPGATVSVTVGTGGAAGAVAGNGGGGGSSSFGVHCSATGGAAGNYGGTTTSPGALGGGGSGGDINMGGDSGKPSEGLVGGSGGAAARGGGGGMAGYVTAGGVGQFPGGGGAGGDATFGGGVGAGGLVFVRWGV